MSACTTGFSCPAVVELDDNRVLVVGADVSLLTGWLRDKGVSVGEDEAAVIIDRELLNKMMDTPEDLERRAREEDARAADHEARAARGEQHPDPHTSHAERAKDARMAASNLRAAAKALRRRK